MPTKIKILIGLVTIGFSISIHFYNKNNQKRLAQVSKSFKQQIANLEKNIQKIQLKINLDLIMQSCQEESLPPLTCQQFSTAEQECRFKENRVSLPTPCLAYLQDSRLIIKAHQLDSNMKSNRFHQKKDYLQSIVYRYKFLQACTEEKIDLKICREMKELSDQCSTEKNLYKKFSQQLCKSYFLNLKRYVESL